MNRLSGKTVIVVGAAGSIGREVASRIAAEGARVGATDLPESPCDEVAKLLAETGEANFVSPADASDRASFSAFLEQSRRRLGPVDVLVNVAGYWEIVDFVSSDGGHWDQMIRANLLTAMTTCHVVLTEMIERGEGSIINFASTAGEYGSIRPSAAYAASKGGVIAFTKSLAREVSPLGIRVNSVSPGPIDTPMLQAASPEQRNIAASRTLLGRLGTVNDIAQAVIYLASDEASFVTGEVLRVNGGSLI